MLVFPVISPSISSVSVTYITNAVDATNGSSFSFTSTSFGPAAADRKIVIGVSSENGGSGERTISALTVGGVSATQLVRSYQAGNDCVAELWIATVPTGTSGTVAITWSGSVRACGIGVWAVNGASSTAFDTASNSQTSSISAVAVTTSCEAGGVIIGMVGGGQANPVSSYSWSNANEDFDATVDAGDRATHSGASNAYAAAQSSLAITVTPSVSGELSAVTISLSPGA